MSFCTRHAISMGPTWLDPCWFRGGFEKSKLWPCTLFAPDFAVKKIESNFDSPKLHFKNTHTQELPHFRNPQDVSIWKFGVINVLFSQVFHVFSTVELISPCKNSEFGRLSFFIDFLHYFTLFGIDMNHIYRTSSSLIATIFWPLWNIGFSGPDLNLILALCHTMKLRWQTSWPIFRCASISTG